MWLRLVTLLITVFDKFFKEPLVATISAATKIPTWVVRFILNLVEKKSEPIINTVADHEDRTSSDKDSLNQYQNDIKGNANEDQLIKDELGVLDPHRRN